MTPTWTSHPDPEDPQDSEGVLVGRSPEKGEVHKGEGVKTAFPETPWPGVLGPIRFDLYFEANPETDERVGLSPKTSAAISVQGQNSEGKNSEPTPEFSLPTFHSGLPDSRLLSPDSLEGPKLGGQKLGA